MAGYISDTACQTASEHGDGDGIALKTSTLQQEIEVQERQNENMEPFISKKCIHFFVRM